jgi:hypothetical protein
MKMFRIVDDTEAIEATDCYFTSGGLRAVPSDYVFRVLHKNLGVILRPIPEPTWRKISDGPVTYPCWFANGSDDVGEGYLTLQGNRHCIGKSSVWEAGITHWMPRDPAPKPPAPTFFEEWFVRNWPNGQVVNAEKAFEEVIKYAKGQR